MKRIVYIRSVAEAFRLFCLMSFCVILLPLVGCKKKINQRWTVVATELTNHTAIIYWRGEVAEQRSALQEYSWEPGTWDILNTNMLEMRIDLEAKKLVQKYIPVAHVRELMLRSAQCASNSIPNLSDEMRVLAASCEGTNSIVVLVNRLSAKRLLVVSENSTNSLPPLVNDYPRFGSVNETGDVLVAALSSASRSVNGKRSKFLLFKQGRWLAFSVDSEMPDLREYDSEYYREVSISEPITDLSPRE